MSDASSSAVKSLLTNSTLALGDLDLGAACTVARDDRPHTLTIERGMGSKSEGLSTRWFKNLSVASFLPSSSRLPSLMSSYVKVRAAKIRANQLALETLFANPQHLQLPSAPVPMPAPAPLVTAAPPPPPTKLDEDQLQNIVEMLEESALADLEEEDEVEEEEDVELMSLDSEDECDWPASPSSSPSSSSPPALIPLHEESHEGKTFYFPPTSAEMEAYNKPHDPSIIPTGALKPLHNCLAWLYPSETFHESAFPSEHPDSTDLRTGAASLEDCLSWLLPRAEPVVHSFAAAEEDPMPMPEDGDFARSDLKTGYAAPRWSCEWLEEAYQQRDKVHFVPYSKAVWSERWQQYQWVRGAPEPAQTVVPLEFDADSDGEDEDEDEEEEQGEFGLYFAAPDEPRYSLGGRKVTIEHLEAMAQDWWLAADELYLQDEGLSLQAVKELSEFCTEEAGESGVCW